MKGKWTQNRKKKKGNAVLQKYMVAVDEFIKSKGSTEEVENDHALGFIKKKSRKELRKEKRKMKKAKMKSHYEGKKAFSLPFDDGGKSTAPADKNKQKRKMEKTKKQVSKAESSQARSVPENKPDNIKAASPKKGKKLNKLQESRKRALLEANEDEDREIKKLERCLGLNKRKNKKTLPQSFVADGLDYILGMLDSGSSAMGVCDDDDDMDMAKENFEKLNEEDDSQPSDDDENPEDEMDSDSSDQSSLDADNEVDEEESDDDGNDDMGENVDEEEEEMEDDQHEVDESNAVDSDKESEVDTDREADALDKKTSGAKSDTVN